MSKKDDANGSISSDRASRLCKLLKSLAKGGQTRAALLRHLRCHQRGFYRDLEILRELGIKVESAKGKYALAENVDDAIRRLPFPDPGLTLGEALDLARGRSTAHRKIQTQLDDIQS